MDVCRLLCRMVTHVDWDDAYNQSDYDKQTKTRVRFARAYSTTLHKYWSLSAGLQTLEHERFDSWDMNGGR